jgi:hypothetical protein
VSRQEDISHILLWEQLAAKAKAKASAIREQLAEDARAELKEQGTAPTWRLPEVGVVSLPVSQESVYVRDESALVEWVRVFHPDEIETVEKVRPGFVNTLLSESRGEGEDVVWMREGALVAGLGIRPGGLPLALSFRPTHDARQVAGAVADKLIGEWEQQLSEPVVIAGDD